MESYKQIKEISKEWKLSERRINTLCLEGRINGAVKFGTTWAIPSNAQKPEDARIKTGKYIKNKV